MTTEELPDAADLYTRKDDFHQQWVDIPSQPENPQENTFSKRRTNRDSIIAEKFEVKNAFAY